MEDTIRSQWSHLDINTPAPLASSWAALLRRGVGVVLEHPVSMRDFMITVLGMEERYATESVPGLFLNNAPVDDWRSEMVGDGDQVGMSGTMPGLCGIALRRSSPIRAFRPDLVDRHHSKLKGVATVKMFNFVAVDCCDPVFARGVVVSPDALAQYLDDQGASALGDACRWNGGNVDCGALREVVASAGGDILLTVRGEGRA